MHRVDVGPQQQTIVDAVLTIAGDRPDMRRLQDHRQRTQGDTSDRHWSADDGKR